MKNVWVVRQIKGNATFLEVRAFSSAKKAIDYCTDILMSCAGSIHPAGKISASTLKQYKWHEIYDNDNIIRYEIRNIPIV